MKKNKISIIPFKGDNYIKNIDFLNGRLLNFEPNEDLNNIIKNDHNINLNITGLTAYCSKIINDSLIEVLYRDVKLEVLLIGVKSVYEIKPSFIYGQYVESLNGTVRQGIIDEINWHHVDKEFKYFIKDLKGKRISRQCSSVDFKKTDML